jgi:hypothetical protein
MEGKGRDLIRSMSRYLPRVVMCDERLQSLLWACSQAAHVKNRNNWYT